MHTVQLGFAQVGSTETPEETAYHQALTNLGTKDRKLMKIKTDLTASKSSIEKIDGKLSAAEVARLGNVALVAAAILSGTAATAIAAKTAAGIVAGKNVAEIINTAIEDKGLQATLKELQQGAYDLETEVIDQTAVVQTQAERVNEKLAAWEKALPEGEYREVFLGDSMAGLMLTEVKSKQVTLERDDEQVVLKLKTDIFLNAKRR
ncbi:MAG: hypothetical protein OXN25_07510 [Candidatus Poribacteria bacterium]|nr:hypothetical protein [Candidatus Poribacteria bacterium]